VLFDHIKLCVIILGPQKLTSLPAILDWPPGLCDYRSVDLKTGTFSVALVYPDREGETLGVKYNPNQKWKYIRGMTQE
jgi:hypothetical protein